MNNKTPKEPKNINKKNHKKLKFLRKIFHKIFSKKTLILKEIHPLKSIESKLPIFYKLLVSIAIFFAVILFYFIVMVSTAPKSIKFITQKIQTNLEKNFDNRVTIKETFINFTKYGSFKIAVNNINIAYQDIEINPGNTSLETTKYLNIPKIEAELGLGDLIFLKFNPKKIKIIRPEIVIDDTKSLLNRKNSDSAHDNEQFLTLINFLSTLKKNKNSIENFEIEDAKINFQNQNSYSTLIIKNSKIKTKYNHEALDISIQADIYFANSKTNSSLDSSCKLSKVDGLQCDMSIFNFVPNSLVGINPVFDYLAQIETNINGLVKIKINNSQAIRTLSFDVRADRGSFNSKDLFKDKIEFRQLKADGDFDFIKNIFNLNKIDAILISNIANQTEIANPHITAKLEIKKLDQDNIKFDSSINIENVLIDELSRFWPLTLSQNSVREWVLKSLSKGSISKASTNFTIIKNNQDSTLEDINAQVNFVNANLQYHPNFPEITKLEGLASFTKNDMKIDIKSGKVLNSKISSAKIAIDDFQMPINILSIYAKASGSGADGLKHASDNLDYRDVIDKFINGRAESEVNISIPLKDEVNLKQMMIGVNANLIDTKNDFFNGDLQINIKKDFESNIFNTAINLKNCEIHNQELQLNKKKSQDASLSFNIDVADNKIIKFTDILLTNDDLFSPHQNANVKKTKSAKQQLSKIDGDLTFAIDPFRITNFKFRNRNFSANNFNINYVLDEGKPNKEVVAGAVKNLDKSQNKKVSANLTLNAQYLNIANFLNSKTNHKNFNIPENFKMRVSVDNLELANKKSFKKLQLNLACSNSLCYSGNISANLSRSKNNPKNLNLKIIKTPQDKMPPLYKIEGIIPDIGFIAEGLNISNIITGGDVKISILQNIVNKKLVLDGNLKSTSNITIFESEAVKKLAKNDFLSSVQDKIFSDDKTTFGSLIVDFTLDGDELIIKSLIANNFKIGITAKGKINLKNNAVAIKGMIVPGYIINSLFGLGKIPILGSVIRGVLTGGEGGGLFSARYEYNREAGAKEGKFVTNKSTAFVPSSISALFE